MVGSPVVAAVAHSLQDDRTFDLLAILYGMVAAFALVQFVRIQLRVPDYGWTTQKIFHLLNFLVAGFRCSIFVFRRDVQSFRPEADTLSLLFFTTYAVLALFWAEIYYQARALSIENLRPSFIKINGAVYAVQIIFWLIIWWKPIRFVVVLSKMFFAGVSLFAALGFLVYGGRLYLMLKRFPVESAGRREKLREVGYLTAICGSCFLIRCLMIMWFDAFDDAAHPILSFISVYYLLVEILPSSLVLFLLIIPPKRKIT